MALPFDLDNLRERPGMYLRPVSFDTIVAYLSGIDVACKGEFLKGFREWLIPIVDGGNNLTWDGLILYVAFPLPRDHDAPLGCPEGQTTAIDRLFRCLEEFLEEKGQDQGLRHIRLRYVDWLKAQSWWDASVYGWIQDDLVDLEGKGDDP